ncbi:J domain-containing protein [Agrobacterium salinitolerans]|uniref:J domain-containing protein n=1 Tax=Agrobacterium salinitolerans TaxID=1183413 RepID=A0A4Z1RD52_9HYPH|nr:J domain-containing protein [Agrobacterium salinitolerans]UYZ08604.1 J domain-containing protein [Agrobacterium salinitolerans]
MKPYPLQWPDELPRHKGAREKSPFRTGLNAALDNARKSLVAFGRDTGIQVKPESIVFSSNVGGLGDPRPSDPGIALWFEWDGATRCIAVDRYWTPEANLQAIHHIIEADRTKLRHGSLAIVRAAYKGFIALPTPGGRKRPWREVFGVNPDFFTTSTETINGLYRDLAKKAHPDAPSGSTDAMTELNVAKAEALEELGGRR